jgi:hypothetical protein
MSTINPTEIKEVAENTMATFATLMHRSIERLAGLHKATLDALEGQTVDLNKTARDSFKVAPPPAQNVLELAETGVHSWINTQKAIVDLIVQQSAHVADVAKDHRMYSKPVEIFTELVQQSAERTVEAQKTVLDYAATQNKAASEAIRKQAGAAGRPFAVATDSMEKGLASLIDAQKEVLDAAAKLPKTAARP